MNKELLKSIHKDVTGIIWITTSPISRDLTHFYEIDYLLDGLISRRILEGVEFNNNNSLLFSESFGEQFFVLHACQSDIKLQNELNLIKKTNRSIIKIINTTENQYGFNHEHYRFEELQER